MAEQSEARLGACEAENALPLVVAGSAVAGPALRNAVFDSVRAWWTKGSAIELRSDSVGARLSISDGRGVNYQQPAIAALPPENCESYRELHRKYPGERICQSRFTDAACNACLEGEASR